MLSVTNTGNFQFTSKAVSIEQALPARPRLPGAPAVAGGQLCGAVLRAVHHGCLHHAHHLPRVKHHPQLVREITHDKPLCLLEPALGLACAASASICCMSNHDRNLPES